MLRSGLPPGPRLPRALQTPLLWLLPSWWLTRCHRRYGDTFTVDVAPMGHVVYLADPTDLRTVFAGDASTYHAGAANSIMVGLLGEKSVLLLDEDEHRDRRRTMLPPFHREAVQRQVQQIAAIAAAGIDGWPVGRSFPAADRIRAITLEVILRIVIGSGDAERLAGLRIALPRVLDAGALAIAGAVWPRLMRLRPWRGVLRTRAEADRLIHAEIAARRADPALADRTDVLAMLVRSGMTDAELRDQVMSLLAAGHETVTTALSWALERLVRHPDVLERAVRAADEHDDEYLDAVVKETLRVRPVVWDVLRELTAPVELGGHVLPAGTTVAAAIGLVHADERHYAYPERFEPARMIGAAPSPTTWLPFGGGVRRCLGATFALVEMRVVLGEILRRVELAPTSAPAERRRARNVTLAPHRGAAIRVATRRTSPVDAARRPARH